jgi:hypothetical protein
MHHITHTIYNTQRKTKTMGLDMYLSIATYLHDWNGTPPEEKASYRKVLAEVGVASFKPLSHIPYVTIKLLIADWKNAYQIHQWLVNRAQDGDDRRQVETEVCREDLQELVDLCKRLLEKRDREEAAASLPPPDDLWDTEEDWNDYYDYWRGRYWSELVVTAEQLGAVLNNPKFDDWEFFYLGPVPKVDRP